MMKVFDTIKNLRWKNFQSRKPKEILDRKDLVKLRDDKTLWANHVDFFNPPKLGLSITIDVAGMDMQLTLEGTKADYHALTRSENDLLCCSLIILERAVTNAVREKFRT